MAPWLDVAHVTVETAWGMAKLVAIALAAGLLLGALVPGWRIRPEGISRRTLAHELAFGVATLLVGGTITAAMGWLDGRGLLPLDTSIPEPQVFAVEVVGYVAAFDLYFYLLHRLLHTRWLFARVHWVHHRAPVPSALTAVAFHPVEAALTGGFLPLVLFVVPLHAFSVMVIGFLQLVAVVFVHSGYEPFPRRWHRTWLVRLCITPLVHDAHHAHFDRNFGAYTTIWDRMFRTLDAGAVDAFYRRRDAASPRPGAAIGAADPVDAATAPRA